MSFFARLRGWFRGDSRTESRGGSGSSSNDRAVTRDLDAFATSRQGVEAYVEPRTQMYPMSVVLVAADGEYLRRPVSHRQQVVELCDRRSIPLYDAAKVGYPRRMRDYQQGARPERVELDDLPPWPGDTPGDGAPGETPGDGTSGNTPGETPGDGTSGNTPGDDEAGPAR